MHKVPCNLIHVNLTGREKSDLLKHNTFSKSITAELWICLQVSQAAVRIRRGAGYRHSQAEVIEASFRNKIRQPCDYTHAGFLNHLMAELKGCFLDNRTRYLFLFIYKLLCLLSSFPGGLVSRVCLQCRRPGLVPGPGRSPGGGNGHPPQYSCLENPVERGAWWLQSVGSQKSWAGLSD